jgi:hypothetical protein
MLPETLPVGWQRLKVAEFGFRTLDVTTPYVCGWKVVRPCGCTGEIGMRLDRHEQTFGVIPCDEHEYACRQTLDALHNMPPQDREIGELFAELLERELA